MNIQFFTIRINVTGTAALDGSTLFTGTPDTAVIDAVNNIMTFSVVGPIGVFDLAAITGIFNHPLLLQGLSVENDADPHVAGSNVSIQSPSTVDNTATRKSNFAFPLGGKNGLLPNVNYLVPIDHRLSIDTSADGGTPGPHTIQFSVARATPEVLNSLLAIPNNDINPQPVWVAPVDVASLGNETLATLAPGDVIDGVTLAEGNDVLLRLQTAPAENGVYTIQSAAPPVRRSDMSANGEVLSGMVVPVTGGVADAFSAWMLATPNPIVVDTTSQSYRLFGGDGLAQTAARTFVDGDLTANVLTFTHGLGVQHLTWAVFDNNDVYQALGAGDVTATDANNMDFDFTTEAPLTGTWTVRVVG